MTVEMNEELLDDKIEVEVVDDTPPEDRNRVPLDPKVVAELESDEDTEAYSEAVKKRIDKMRRATHDERREKEKAARERDEAMRLAAAMREERNALRAQPTSGEQWALDKATRLAKAEIDNAKRQYRDAVESGDSEKIAEAQLAMTTAGVSAKESQNFRAQFTPEYWNSVDNRLQQQNAVLHNSQQSVEVAKPDEAALAWQERNPWFGKDDEMTAFALGTHQKLVKDGVSTNSDEYFKKIDARMRLVFPDQFKTAASTNRQPATVVAPVGRTPSKGNKVVLTQSQVAVARRLGITPEAYALELRKIGEA